MGSRKKQKIGEKFFLGMHHICFQRPENGTAKLKKILMGGKTLSETEVTSNQTLSVNKEGLFGGERKEGGFVGDIDIEMGESTQGQNTYLMQRISSSVPAFRHLVGMVFKRCYMSAMTPYIKKVSSVWEVIHETNWYPETANINGGCNGAHIFRDAFVNLMKNSPDALDDIKMRAAADTFYNENLGISFPFLGGSVEKFIEEVERHTHSKVVKDVQTGLYSLVPIRNDYDIQTLSTFTTQGANANVLKVLNFDRKTYEELTNEIIVKYRPQGTTETVPITLHNMASIRTQAAEVSREFTYLGLDTEESAKLIGNFDLSISSTPFATVKIACNRDANNLNETDLIILNIPEEDINNAVYRITEVDRGTLTEREIKISATEEIFDKSNVSYLGSQQSLFTDPQQPAINFPNQRAYELGYYDVKVNELADDITDQEAIIAGIAGEPNQYVSNISMYVFDQLEDADGLPAPICLTASAITKSQTTIPIKDSSSSVLSYQIGNYALLNDELIRVDAISETELTVGRGCLDTIPAEHAIDSIVYMCEQNILIADQEYMVGLNTEVKILMNGGIDTLPLASASVNNITPTARYHLPYPPKVVGVNSNIDPQFYFGDFDVVWGHSNRDNQLTKPYVGWYEGSTASKDADVTYHLIIKDEDDASLFDDNTLTGTNYLYSTAQEFLDTPKTMLASGRVISDGTGGLTTPSSQERLNNNLTIELKAVNTSGDSATVIQTINRVGYGYNYDNMYEGG